MALLFICYNINQPVIKLISSVAVTFVVFCGGLSIVIPILFRKKETTPAEDKTRGGVNKHSGDKLEDICQYHNKTYVDG